MTYLTKRQKLDIQAADMDRDYKTFEPQYRDLNDYFLPSRGRFWLGDTNRGDRRNHKILDNTGYLAARTLIAGMQSGLTSPAKEWRRLTTNDPELAEYGPVREWLDSVNRRMTSYLLRGNFYIASANGYGNVGTFGTACTFMDPHPETMAWFHSFPVGSFRIATDYRGRVNVFRLEFQMTVKQLVDEFGEYDPKTGRAMWERFSKYVKTQWDKGQYHTWIDVCHVVQPNEEYIPGHFDSKYKRFASCFYEKNCEKTEDGERYLREKGYDFFPAMAPRWSVTGMDAYGTDCPGMASIGDNKQLQHGERKAARAIDKMIDPAMTASADLKNSRASLVSGDITFLDDAARSFYKPAHDVRIDISHLDQRQEFCRQRIKKAYYEDLFLMLAESDRREFTATEIVERKEEKLLVLGPVTEQLNIDQNDPLTDNMFYLMNEAGVIPPAPEELQGMPLKVEYISTMAQAQKLVGIGNLDRLLQMSSAILQVNPASAAKIDFDQIIDEYADALGTSPRVVRSDEKVAEIRAAQEQAMKAQQQAEAITALTGAAKNLSQSDMGGDNALTRLAGQAGQLNQQAAV
jgi:hypothetical protein